jgi:hypothetical protein
MRLADKFDPSKKPATSRAKEMAARMRSLVRSC